MLLAIIIWLALQPLAILAGRCILTGDGEG
jgi:hypothetical protein